MTLGAHKSLSAAMMTLKTYLRSQRITQAAFAARLNVDQSTVSKLCDTRPRLSLNLALKIERETEGAVVVESWPQFRALRGRG